MVLPFTKLVFVNLHSLVAFSEVFRSCLHMVLYHLSAELTAVCSGVFLWWIFLLNYYVMKFCVWCTLELMPLLMSVYVSQISVKWVRLLVMLHHFCLLPYLHQQQCLSTTLSVLRSFMFEYFCGMLFLFSRVHYHVKTLLLSYVQ
jgi:hypothetical protein